MQDQSPWTSSQRSLQTSEQQRRGEGRRDSTSPAWIPPEQRSPSHSHSYTSGALCSRESGFAQEPYPSFAGKGPLTAGDKARVWLWRGEDCRSTQSPPSPPLPSPHSRKGGRGEANEVRVQALPVPFAGVAAPQHLACRVLAGSPSQARVPEGVLPLRGFCPAVRAPVAAQNGGGQPPQ